MVKKSPLCSVVRSERVEPRPGFCHGWRLTMPACERVSAAAVPPVTVRCRKRCSGRDRTRDARVGEVAVGRWDW